MSYKSILDAPTIYNGVHESVYRVSRILEEVEVLLKMGASNEVILRVIDGLESLDGVESNE